MKKARNRMKTNILPIFLMILLASSVYGQASSSSFAQAFNALGASQIDNEIMIPNPLMPKVAVLYYVKGSSGRSISLLSLDHGKVRTEWHLAQLPEFMEAIDPANLRIASTDDGLVISLHGCAPHLCGGKGLAGGADICGQRAQDVHGVCKLVQFHADVESCLLAGGFQPWRRSKKEAPGFYAAR